MLSKEIYGEIQMNRNRFLLNTNRSVSKINNLIIVCICSWFIWPYLNYKLGIMVFLGLLVIWFLFTNVWWLFQCLSVDLVFFFAWVFTFVPYLISGNFYYGEMLSKIVLVSFFLFFCGMLINQYYMYYLGETKILGKIAFFSISFYFFASIQSMIGLKEYPLAARALATGIDPMQGIYLSLGIGGFGFVYSAVFINIALLYFILKKTPNSHRFSRVFCLIVFITNAAMLFAASYATSMLFMFIGTICVLFIKGKKSLVFSIILAFFFLVLFPKELIGHFLIEAATLFESNDVISNKFTDFAQGFISESFGSQTSTRSHLYLISLKTFLQNPLFGIYGPFGNSFNAQVGGHSGWLDLLAFYGLFGSVPLFTAIFLNFRKHLRYYEGHPYKSVLLTAQILFIFFGFINPIIYIYQIGFVFFVVLPVLPHLPKAFSRKDTKEFANENTMDNECSFARGKFTAGA